MSENKFRIWKISPLVDRSINPDPQFQCIAPILHHNHRESAQHHGILLAPSIGWKHTTSSKMHPLHVDILCSERKGKTALWHCMPQLMDDGVDKGSPILNLVGQTPSITPSYRATAYVKSAWMSPTEAVYFWTENSKVVAVLSTLAPSNDIPNRCSVGILWKSGTGQEPDAEVCPFSGHVCLLNRPRSNESGSVQIIDYV
jgi:hypothetical protein